MNPLLCPSCCYDKLPAMCRHICLCGFKGQRPPRKGDQPETIDNEIVGESDRPVIPESKKEEVDTNISELELKVRGLYGFGVEG